MILWISDERGTMITTESLTTGLFGKIFNFSKFQKDRFTDIDVPKTEDYLEKDNLPEIKRVVFDIEDELIKRVNIVNKDNEVESKMTIRKRKDSE